MATRKVPDGAVVGDVMAEVVAEADVDCGETVATGAAVGCSAAVACVVLVGGEVLDWEAAVGAAEGELQVASSDVAAPSTQTPLWTKNRRDTGCVDISHLRFSRFTYLPLDLGCC
jgi:hypothetical protein